MKKIDTAYLEDISDSINKIESFIGEMSSNEFEQDEKTQFAVFHALEIIGEAANSLSSEFKSINGNFPVKQLSNCVTF